MLAQPFLEIKVLPVNLELVHGFELYTLEPGYIEPGYLKLLCVPNSPKIS